MAKSVKILKAKVVECELNANPSESDKKNGYKWFVYVEDEKEITDTLKAPDYPRYKSAVELKPGTYYLEINSDAMISKDTGRLVKWTHILKTHEVK